MNQTLAMTSHNAAEANMIADFNKAVELMDKGKFKKAEMLFRKCLNIVESKEAYLNIGNCYKALDNDAKSILSYKKACSDSVAFLDGSRGDYASAYSNLGLAYYTIGNDDEAIKAYTKAIKIDPKLWDAWWNCSTAHLRKASSGQVDLFPSAWEMYNARFLKTPSVPLKNDKEELVYWDMQSDVESIVILQEQGIGDLFMWSRYLPLLAKKASKIYIQCHPSLDYFFSEYNTVRLPSECDAVVALPMCSLAAAFPSVPSPLWINKNEKFIFSDSEKLNVGIVHCGSTGHTNDRNRSVNIHRFHPLSKYVNLYSLVPGFKTTKYVTGLDITSWEDTTKYINGLDLVITVDSSVAHLAGSLGACVWLLQPLKETDFRWGNNVSSCVWYPEVRIFNNPNSWEFVFSQVEQELKDEAGL